MSNPDQANSSENVEADAKRNADLEALSSDSPSVVSVVTVARYLTGRKDAILALAAYRKLWLLAAVFVLSAGFAREYDGEDLLHEPWHLLIPHAASIVTSVLLYILVRLPAVRSAEMFDQFIKGYPMFLGLFWMTAPMAWIYAIPFERWLSEGGATRANLWLLAIVSVWRVALMIRVIAVIYDVKDVWRSTIAVLFFGDAVMLTAIHFVPTPVLQVMGGIRLSESEQILMMTKLLLQLIGVPTLALLTIFYLFSLPVTHGVSQAIVKRNVVVRSQVWLLALASILVWAVILPQTQPPLVLSRQVEQSLRNDRIFEALQLMSKNDRTSFPAHWSPAPQVALPSETLPITAVMKVIVARPDDLAPWVRDLYLEKFVDEISGVFYFLNAPENEMAPYVGILAQLMKQSWFDVDASLTDDVKGYLQQLANDSESELSDETKQQLQAIQEQLK